MELTLAWKLNWHYCCNRSILEAFRYFLDLKFGFNFLMWGEKTSRVHHQYDQRQAWYPKAGGEIDGPCCRPHHCSGNTEKARHKRIVILLGMGDSAAVAANYLTGTMTLTHLSRGWKMTGDVGSAGERMWSLMVLTNCIYEWPEQHTGLSRTVNISGETKVIIRTEERGSHAPFHPFSLPLAIESKSEGSEGGLRGLWGSAARHLEAKQSSKDET